MPHKMPLESPIQQEASMQLPENASYLEYYLSHISREKRSSASVAYLAALDYLKQHSPIVHQSIVQELKDQRSYLKMIASENFSSLAVQLAMGNLLTDKYAEGYPHHRFYAGCDNIDTLESRAETLAKEIFGAEHAYVQPHSGADANLVAFWAILVKRIQNKEVERLGKKNIDAFTPEEYEQVRQLLINQKIMGLSLNSGGHLTHGYRHNISSKMMKAIFYDVDPKTLELDYSAIEKKAKEERPLILLAGYSAYSRKINFAKMKEIADSIGAVFMVDMAHFAGLVAGKVFTGEYNPIAYADIVTTTTHKTLRGPRGGMILCKEEFKDVVNKGCPIALGGPLPHMIAAKCVAFEEAKSESFKKYAHKIVENSQYLAQALIKKGLHVLTNGTDNHLVIVDVSQFGINGRQAEYALRLAHITCNRNSIPFDKNGPWFTSGIRLGTPALTTLGMGINEMEEIADIIYMTLTHIKKISNEDGTENKSLCQIDGKMLTTLTHRVKNLLQHFVLYPEIMLPS